MKTASETSGTILNAPVFALGVPEKEETEKGPEKIFKEITVKNFSNMGKEIVTQVPGSSEGPIMMNPRRNIPRHILIKLTKIKDKEKLLRATRDKATTNIQGNPHEVMSWFFSRNSAGQKGVAQYISSDEREISATKNTLASKGLIQIWWRHQKIYR